MSNPVVIKSADDLVPAVQWAGDNPKARWYVARMARAFNREDLIPEEWGTEEVSSFREQKLSSEDDLHKSAAIDRAVDAFVDTVEDLKDGAVDQEQAGALVASILAQADRAGVFDETYDAITAGASLYVEDEFVTGEQMEALLASADKIRRVRTQAGVRRYKAPVGTPIIRDPETGKLKADKSKIKLDAKGNHAEVPDSEKPATKHVLTSVSDIEEGDEVTNKDGKTYVVGSIRKTEDGKIKLTVEGEGGEIESYELAPTSRVKVARDEEERPEVDEKGIAERRKNDEKHMDEEISRLKERGAAGDKAAAAEARRLGEQRKEQKSLGKDAKDAVAATKREPIKKTAPDETARTRGKNSHAVTFKDGDKDVTGEFWSEGPVARSAWVQTDDGPVAVKIGTDGKLTKLNYELPTKNIGEMPTGEEKAKALDILKRRQEHAEYEFAKGRRSTWSSPATRKPEPESEKPSDEDVKFAEDVASREQAWEEIATKARENRGKPKLSEKDLDLLMPNRKSDDPELTLDDLQEAAEEPKKPEAKPEPEKAPEKKAPAKSTRAERLERAKKLEADRKAGKITPEEYRKGKQDIANEGVAQYKEEQRASVKPKAEEKAPEPKPVEKAPEPKAEEKAPEKPKREAAAKARAEEKRAEKAKPAPEPEPEKPAAEPEKPKGDGKRYRLGRGYQQWTIASTNDDGTVNLIPAEGAAPVSGKARNRNKVDPKKLVEMKDAAAAPTPLAATQSEAKPADDKKLGDLKDSTGGALSTGGSYNLGRGYQKWKITSVNPDGSVNVEPAGGGDGTRKRWNIAPQKLIPLDADGNKPKAEPKRRGRPKVEKRSEESKLATKEQLEKMQARLAEPTPTRTREDVARERAKAKATTLPAAEVNARTREAQAAKAAEPEPPKAEDFSNHSDYKLVKAEEDARSVVWKAENVRNAVTPQEKATAEANLAAIRAERKSRMPAPAAKPEEKATAAPAKGMSPRVLNALIKAEEARSAGIQAKVTDGTATDTDRAELKASEEQLNTFRAQLSAGQAKDAQKAYAERLDAMPVSSGRRSREELAKEEAERVNRREAEREFFADKQNSATDNEWDGVDDDTLNAMLQGYIAEGELDHADTQSLLKERRERDGRWAGTADDFAQLTDTEVDAKIQEAAAAGNWVELDDLYGERTARGEGDKSAALNARIQELVGNGKSYMEAEAEATGVPLEKLQKNEAIRWMRETYNLDVIQGNRFEELLSTAFKQELDQEIRRAEDASGHLYSPEGYQRMKNQDKEVLWMQAERVAYANASKELIEYWETNGRLTREKFRQRVMEAAGKRGADYQYSNAGNMR